MSVCYTPSLVDLTLNTNPQTHFMSVCYIPSLVDLTLNTNTQTHFMSVCYIPSLVDLTLNTNPFHVSVLHTQFGRSDPEHKHPFHVSVLHTQFGRSDPEHKPITCLCATYPVWWIWPWTQTHYISVCYIPSLIDPTLNTNTQTCFRYACYAPSLVNLTLNPNPLHVCVLHTQFGGSDPEHKPITCRCVTHTVWWIWPWTQTHYMSVCYTYSLVDLTLNTNHLHVCVLHTQFGESDPQHKPLILYWCTYICCTTSLVDLTLNTR